ncbi:MAG: metallophosphoesterase family protein, partial [Chloroflexota bacterium]|nr:metallophosphoesterase family protein [Chloroflexota bacterium]
MQVLVLADIHANLAALEVVLARWDGASAPEIWCLGDMVGYGPEPNRCLERIRALPTKLIPGNHDWAAIGKLDVAQFNPYARYAALWTAGELTPGNRDYLMGLPITLAEPDSTLAHGSPRHPIWEYIFHPAVAKASFAYFDTRLCLVGHTHVPAIFLEPIAGGEVFLFLPPEGERFSLPEGRFIINPGAVGQPRDGDPRASYAIYDSETRTVEHRRVP